MVAGKQFVVYFVEDLGETTPDLSKPLVVMLAPAAAEAIEQTRKFVGDVDGTLRAVETPMPLSNNGLVAAVSPMDVTSMCDFAQAFADDGEELSDTMQVYADYEPEVAVEEA